MGNRRDQGEPDLPWDQIRRDYEQGMLIDDPRKPEPAHGWPTFTQLGEKYDCHRTLIHDRSKRYGWKRSKHKPGEVVVDTKPKIGAPAKYDWDAIEHMYVHGIEVEREGDEDSKELPRRRWLKLADVAAKFGCSHAAIARRANVGGWTERREKFRAHFLELLDQHLADDLALGTANQIKILDRYIALWDRNLRSGSVRADTAADLNTVFRLREFLLGHADKRTESNVSVSLETMQDRHRRARERTAQLSPAETGMIVEGETVEQLAARTESPREIVEVSPPAGNRDSVEVTSPAPPVEVEQGRDIPSAPVADSCQTRQQAQRAALKDTDDRAPFDPFGP